MTYIGLLLDRPAPTTIPPFATSAILNSITPSFSVSSGMVPPTQPTAHPSSPPDRPTRHSPPTGYLPSPPTQHPPIPLRLTQRNLSLYPLSLLVRQSLGDGGSFFSTCLSGRRTSHSYSFLIRHSSAPRDDGGSFSFSSDAPQPPDEK